MRQSIRIACMVVVLGGCFVLAACSGGNNVEIPAPTTPSVTTAPPALIIPDPIPDDPDENPSNTLNPFEINPDSPYWDDIFTGDGILVLDDPYFVEWIQAIHMNRDLFLGRTVQFDGFFMSMLWGEEDEVIYSVARFTMGCCGLHGFEIYLNEIPQPPEDTWVTVTGILEELYIEEIGVAFLRVRVLEMV